MVLTSDKRFFILTFGKSIKVFDLETKQEFCSYENAHEGKKIFIHHP